MFTKKLRVLAGLLIMLMLITNCSSMQNNNAEHNVDPNKGTNSSKLSIDLAVKSSVPWPDAPEQIDNAFRSSLLDFSWSLFQASSENKGNILISPASVYLALGMAYNGAEGETRQAMTETLRAAKLSPQELNEACRDYISILKVMGKNTELSVANSIWYRNEFPISNDFLQINANYFNAEVQSLDFSQPAAADTINGWVKKETRNTIEKIVEQINPETFMFLINAVYFKSDWKEPFDADDTYERDFNSPPGKVKADFMNRKGEMDYFEANDATGIMLPYDDGRFQFFAILPEENTDIRSFISGLNGATVYDYLTSIRTETIKLSIPKFETNFEDELKDELSRLGMGIAFDWEQADFSSMLDKSEDYIKENLYIGGVRHKTFCRVDELGTEASAVTIVDMETTGAIVEPENQIVIVFDRPFVYGIVDVVTGAPLFLGIMENPVE